MIRRENEVIRIIISDTEVSGEIVGMNSQSMTVRMLDPYPGLMTTIPRHRKESPDETPARQAQNGLATLFEKATEFLARRNEIDHAFEEAMARLKAEGLGQSREEAFDAYQANREAAVSRQRNRELTGKQTEVEIARIRSRLVERYAELAKVEEELCADIFGATLSLADVRALRDHFREATEPSRSSGLSD